jgi:hypothetical protein
MDNEAAEVLGESIQEAFASSFRMSQYNLVNILFGISQEMGRIAGAMEEANDLKKEELTHEGIIQG